MRRSGSALAAASAVVFAAAAAFAQPAHAVAADGATVVQNANGDVVAIVSGFADSVKSTRAAAVADESRRAFARLHPRYASSTETRVSLQAGTLTATTTIANIGHRVRDTPKGPSTPPPPDASMPADVDRVSYHLDHNGWSRKTDYVRGAAREGQDGSRGTGWELVSDVLAQNGAGTR